MVYRALQVVRLAIDFDEDLVKMPTPFRYLAHRFHSFASNFSCEHRPKSVPPETYCLVCHIDPALMKQVFDVAKRKWVADV